METMRTVVLATCVISLLCGVLSMLRPNRRFDRQMRLLLSLVFLLAILAPAATGIRALSWDDWEPDTVSSAALEEEIDAQVVTNAQVELAAALTQVLAEQGVPDAAVTVTMHIDPAGGIEIDQVHVACADPGTAETILRQNLGEGVDLHVENTDGALAPVASG